MESLDWELSSGFSVVTGETGTGKSVVVGALKLVLGERADKSLIRTGADQCSVETLFELDDAAEMDQMLSEQGIDPERAPYMVNTSRICFVRDPDGYRVELIERVA